VSVVAALALIVIMAVIFPVAALFLPGALFAGLHGHLQTDDAEKRFEGSELLELSK
jgi:hypothetical protein